MESIQGIEMGTLASATFRFLLNLSLCTLHRKKILGVWRNSINTQRPQYSNPNENPA